MSNPGHHAGKADDRLNDDRLNEVLAEYLQRVDAGEQIDRAQFIGEHAEMADALRSYFETTDEVEQLARPAANDQPRGQTDDNSVPLANRETLHRSAADSSMTAS